MSLGDHIRRVLAPGGTPHAGGPASPADYKAVALARVVARFERAVTLGFDAIPPGLAESEAYRKHCRIHRLPYLRVWIEPPTATLNLLWANCTRCPSPPCRDAMMRAARHEDYAAEGQVAPEVRGTKFDMTVYHAAPDKSQLLAFRLTELLMADGVPLGHDVWGGGAKGEVR